MSVVPTEDTRDKAVVTKLSTVTLEPFSVPRLVVPVGKLATRVAAEVPPDPEDK